MYSIEPIGFIESPYRKIAKGKVTDEVLYLSAMEEARFHVAQANADLDDKGGFTNEFVTCRHAGDVMMVPRENVELMDVSPKQLVSVAAALIPFLENDDVKFLSLSVTPELDSIPILKEYAKKHGAIDGKWNITTGDKKHIYNLARKSYFAVVNEGDGGLQDFIHTPNFILVDKQKQIRGVYDGTKSEEIERLTTDINLLKKQS